MNTIVVDLDHTICIPAPGEDQGPDVKYSEAVPDEALIARLRDLKAGGFRIVVHTSRNMRTFAGDVARIQAHTLPIIVDWLGRHDVPYDEIAVGKPWCGSDGFYVDDRAIRPSELRALSTGEIAALLDAEHRR